MTHERIWSIIEIDQKSPICLFDVYKDEELKEAFIWINTQPLMKKVIIGKELRMIFQILENSSSNLVNSSN